MSFVLPGLRGGRRGDQQEQRHGDRGPSGRVRGCARLRPPPAQVRWCLHLAAAHAQLRPEHPVLHDVRSDGADLARPGAEPEIRECGPARYNTWRGPQGAAVGEEGSAQDRWGGLGAAARVRPLGERAVPSEPRPQAGALSSPSRAPDPGAEGARAGSPRVPCLHPQALDLGGTFAASSQGYWKSPLKRTRAPLKKEAEPSALSVSHASLPPARPPTSTTCWGTTRASWTTASRTACSPTPSCCASSPSSCPCASCSPTACRCAGPSPGDMCPDRRLAPAPASGDPCPDCRPAPGHAEQVSLADACVPLTPEIHAEHEAGQRAGPPGSGAWRDAGAAHGGRAG